MDIHIKLDTRGENMYKFVLTFADGRQAFTHYIGNAGKPYKEFRCFMSEENAYKAELDFYMVVEPGELWGKKELEIRKVVLKGAKGKKMVEYYRF